MSHYRKVCEFGRVHDQCRCIGPHATITIVCDVPYIHQQSKQDKAKPANVNISLSPEQAKQLYGVLLTGDVSDIPWSERFAIVQLIAISAFDPTLNKTED